MVDSTATATNLARAVRREAVQPEPPEHSREDVAKKKTRKAAQVIKIATGWAVWKRQASLLAKRASFPLLRSVIKSQIALNKTIIPHDIVPDQYLVKTLQGHRYLMVFMALVLAWGGLTTVKGLAAGILHGLWLNNWIIGGIPIVILACARLVTSHRVVTGVKKELLKRTQHNGADRAQGQHQ